MLHSYIILQEVLPVIICTISSTFFGSIYYLHLLFRAAFMPRHIQLFELLRGYQQKMRLMRNISGLIRYHVTQKGTIIWLFFCHIGT